MTAKIYRSALKPPKLLFVAPILLYLEIGLCLITTIVLGEPLITVFLFVVLHVYSINKTNQEPHVHNVIRNKYRFLFNCHKAQSYEL